jgi:hypothetical protein
MSSKKPTPYTDLIRLVEPTPRFNILSLDPYVAEGRLAMPYRYFPGPTAARFFLEIRDHERIMGVRCPSCGLVYVPPESTCGGCFVKLEEWVEVGNEGALQAFTVTRYALPVHAGSPPIVYGLIKLDGAHTALLHLLGEVAHEELCMGMRMEAVFRKERKGNILDIAYFRPSGGSATRA